MQQRLLCFPLTLNCFHQTWHDLCVCVRQNIYETLNYDLRLLFSAELLLMLYFYFV